MAATRPSRFIETEPESYLTVSGPTPKKRVADSSRHRDANSPPESKLLLRALDQAFNRKSWHGPNLRGSIRGLTAQQAAWRPANGRHSIAEQVLHAAYWKYVVRRKLTGEKRGSFPLAGSNWFPASDELSAAEWAQMVALLEQEHERLRQAVAAWIARGSRQTRGENTRLLDLIVGIAAHDVYHAGQIALLKRLQLADA